MASEYRGSLGQQLLSQSSILLDSLAGELQRTAIFRDRTDNIVSGSVGDLRLDFQCYSHMLRPLSRKPLRSAAS